MLEISYIKQNVEKKRKLCTNDIKEMEDIFKICSNKTLEVNEKIELLHISGLHFEEIQEIKCLNPDTVLIIENCQFQVPTTFVNGSVVLDTVKINHLSEKNKTFYIRFCNNKYVELLFPKNNSNNLESTFYHIENVETVKITGDATNSSVTKASNCKVKVKNLELKGVTHFYGGALEAENVVISESKIDSLTYLTYEHLTISRSIISSKYNNNVLNFSQGVVTIKSAILTAKMIIFPDKTYEPQNGTLIYLEKGNDLFAKRLYFWECLKAILEQKKGASSKNIDHRQWRQPIEQILQNYNIGNSNNSNNSNHSLELKWHHRKWTNLNNIKYYQRNRERKY